MCVSVLRAYLTESVLTFKSNTLSSFFGTANGQSVLPSVERILRDFSFEP